MKKIFWIAGENSGDLHSSKVIEELNKRNTDLEHFGIGGKQMEKFGFKPLFPFERFSVMGFLEVFKHLFFFINVEKRIKQIFLVSPPDLVILVDYPGFNMRIAEFAKKNNILVHYYISPQIWAWKESRIKKIKRDVDQMYVILPFEKEFYEEKHNFPVHFVGHPLLDAIADRKQISISQFCKENNLNDKPIIALLPGSRQQEIKKMLSVMLKMVEKFTDYQFVIALSPFVNGE